MLDIKINARDNATKYLSELPGVYRHATILAMASMGKAIRKDFQAKWRENTTAFGWAPRNPHTRILNRAANKARLRSGPLKGLKHPRHKKGEFKGQVKRRLSNTTEPAMLRLYGGIRTLSDWRDMLISVGFVNPDTRFRMGGQWVTTEEMLRRHAQGYETPVTPRARRRAFALGMPLAKSTTSIKTPPRGGFTSKMYAEWRDKGPERFRVKFNQKLQIALARKGRR